MVLWTQPQQRQSTRMLLAPDEDHITTIEAPVRSVEENRYPVALEMSLNVRNTNLQEMDDIAFCDTEH